MKKPFLGSRDTSPRWPNSVFELTPKRGSQFLAYRTCAAITYLEHLVLLTGRSSQNYLSIFCLAFSAQLIPPLVQASSRVLTALPETSVSSYLMLAIQPNVRTPARRTTAERAGRAVQHRLRLVPQPNRDQNKILRLFGGNFICSHIWWMSVSFLWYINFSRPRRVCPKLLLLWPETKLGRQSRGGRFFPPLSTYLMRLMILNRIY